MEEGSDAQWKKVLMLIEEGSDAQKKKVLMLNGRRF
jgi:hypothetical protein